MGLVLMVVIVISPPVIRVLDLTAIVQTVMRKK